jgi:S1-C subfamily serine protease
MEPLNHSQRRRGVVALRRLHTRFVLAVVAAVIGASAAAGVALAQTRATPIGTGVVVIETRLAYQGGQAAGTGMVLTSSGEVLTNNHVIRGATAIKVVVPSTGRSYTAKIVGYDVTDDVAVLKLSGASNLRTVTVGGAVKVGQVVKAVGNAGGTGSLVSASGVVTGLARAITVSDEQGGSARLTGLIETNAALRPGDSGGPLFNASGKVVGMDTAASTGYGRFQDVSSNDGYAIPIAKAVSIAGRIDAGKASATIHVGATAFLGVSLAPDGYASGAVVSGVVPGGPAASAGLAAGDAIVSFDGRAIASASALGAVIATERPGKRVSVTFVDQTGASHVATVTLASGPPR